MRPFLCIPVLAASAALATACEPVPTVSPVAETTPPLDPSAVLALDVATRIQRDVLDGRRQLPPGSGHPLDGLSPAERKMLLRLAAQADPTP